MYDASLECLAEAHHRLDNLSGVNPLYSATGSIEEVLITDPDRPEKLKQALEIVENASDPDDATRAANILSDVLSGTPYDPETGEFYPDNR